MQDFRELQVWQKSHQLVLQVYAKTANFPNHELFGLTSQMRRAAVSVAANIVEGRCRSGDKEFARFLQIAVGSVSELEYFSILAFDLGLLEQSGSTQIGEDASEIRRMLCGLISSMDHN